jgi:arsenate reductase
MVPPRGVRAGRPRLRGDASPRPDRSQPTADGPKKRVLFMCIGNSCRSQMAEAFARTYGSDVLIARSAGLAPAMIIQPETLKVLQERNIRADGQFPKGPELIQHESFDMVVNMSGQRLQIPNTRVIDWPVPDPIGQSEAVYRTVATQIEGLVIRLILELRGNE